jgi:hypothetical protein
MSRTLKIITSIITIFAGWLLTGIGYTIKIGHPTNTILILLGITCFISGCLWLIISIKSTKKP